jgi:hypothetical protein
VEILNSVCSDLKRFSGFGFRSKLQTDVDFPLNHLDMSNFASKYSHEFSNKGNGNSNKKGNDNYKSVNSV